MSHRSPRCFHILLRGAFPASASCVFSATLEAMNGFTSGFVFDPQLHRLDNKIYLLRNITGNVTTLHVASKRDGVDGPVAVEASRDGTLAFVANARSKTILSVHLAGSPPALYSCRFVPATLSPLHGNALFRLTEPSDGPMRWFDGDHSEPRVVFVPPFHAGSGGSLEKQ